MQKLYRLPERLRSKLASPIGRLFTVEAIESGAFKRALDRSPMVVTVGDKVTETVGALGRVPDVQVVDSKENRIARKPPRVPAARTIRVDNPAGAISAEAVDGIRDAFSGRKPARVLVNGEEDLLALPAVVFAPVSATMYYGQPGEGIVAVRVDARSKARCRAIMADMGLERLD